MTFYKEKQIREIIKDDNKVCISGLMINKDNNLIFIDDGTGVFPVSIETNLQVNSFVRVYGYLVKGEELSLQGIIIQDLSKVSKNLYNKLKTLLNQK